VGDIWLIKFEGGNMKRGENKEWDVKKPENIGNNNVERAHKEAKIKARCA
jgi:hypothetical protein